MEQHIRLALAHDYDVELLDELPQPGEGDPILYDPGTLNRSDAGLLVRVMPHGSKPWIGIFAFGMEINIGFSGLFSCPDPKELCVVARGLGVIVKTDHPAHWEELRVFPITDVRQHSEANLLLVVDYTTITAWGRYGLAWRTQDLGWDRVEIQSMRSRTVSGRGWSPVLSTYVPFEVNLVNGSHQGGANPEEYSGRKTS